ncbi:hypothetical protein FA13DRAFT_1711165 [Coprinellus micaceus]|uniref:Uncharacterized protein n=1 Tax=Coprinellus micaceus TaxID=71717 RepID=A0A4Y7T550_COPMI|nr:hypothetical protein FA13DRAFT_1711165 [Coprinellus micaceus]
MCASEPIAKPPHSKLESSEDEGIEEPERCAQQTCGVPRSLEASIWPESPRQEQTADSVALAKCAVEILGIYDQDPMVLSNEGEKTGTGGESPAGRLEGMGTRMPIQTGGSVMWNTEINEGLTKSRTMTAIAPPPTSSLPRRCSLKTILDPNERRTTTDDITDDPQFNQRSYSHHEARGAREGTKAPP